MKFWWSEWTVMFTFPVQLIVEIIIMSLSPHHQRRSLRTSQLASFKVRPARRSDDSCGGCGRVWRRPWRKTCDEKIKLIRCGVVMQPEGLWNMKLGSFVQWQILEYCQMFGELEFLYIHLWLAWPCLWHRCSFCPWKPWNFPAHCLTAEERWQRRWAGNSSSIIISSSCTSANTI